MRTPPPSFELTRIVDGRSSEPELVRVGQLPLDTVMGRRGMIGVGIGAAALLIAPALEAQGRGGAKPAPTPAPEPRAPYPAKAAHARKVSGLRAIPALDLLLSASADNTIKLWSLSQGTLITRLVGHTSDVTAIAATADGHLLFSASQDGSVRAWSLPDGRPASFVLQHEQGVTDLAVTRDGQWLITVSESRTRIWSLPGGRLHALIPGQSPGVVAIALSTDGQRLMTLSGFSNPASIWELPNGSPVGNTPRLNLSQASLISPGFDLFITGANDGKVTILNADGSTKQTLEVFAPQPRQNIQSLALSADSKTIIAGAATGQISLFDLDENRVRGTLSSIGATEHLLLTPDGRRLFSAHADGVIVQWDAQSNTFVRYLADPELSRADAPAPLRAHRAKIVDLAIAHDGRTVVTASADNLAKVWSIPQAALTARFAAHKSGISGLTMLPGMGMCLTTSGSTMSAWKLPDPAPPRPVAPPAGPGRGTSKTPPPSAAKVTVSEIPAAFDFAGQTAEVLSTSASGRTLASISSDRAVRLFSLENGALIRTLSNPTAQNSNRVAPAKVLFSPDGSFICIVEGGAGRLVALEGDRLVALISSSTDITAAAWAPDGKTLAIGRQAGVVELWSAYSGGVLERRTVIATARASTRVGILRFLDQGARLLVAGEDGTLAMLRTAGLGLIQVAEIHSGAIRAIDLTPDGRTVVTASADQTLRLWSAEGLAPEATLSAHPSGVSSVVISPDGNWMVSGDDGGVGVLWNLRTRVFHSYLFDPAATDSDQKARTYDVYDSITGQTITYNIALWECHSCWRHVHL